MSFKIDPQGVLLTCSGAKIVWSAEFARVANDYFKPLPYTEFDDTFYKNGEVIRSTVTGITVYTVSFQLTVIAGES